MMDTYYDSFAFWCKGAGGASINFPYRKPDSAVTERAEAVLREGSMVWRIKKA